ncbi:MAG: glutamate racemase, partial [Bacillota bacterium]
VVACNTATSVAINEIRTRLDIPVVGMEPALKPAVECAGRGQIAVMATPMTLREKKFHDLLQRYDEQKEIVLLPCPGLVELIEKGCRSGPEIRAYLTGLFAPVDKQELTAIVLGCTHYIFIKDEISQMVDDCVQVIDGNCGTAKQLQRVLTQEGLLGKGRAEAGEKVWFLTSGDASRVIPLCRELLNSVKY